MQLDQLHSKAHYGKCDSSRFAKYSVIASLISSAVINLSSMGGVIY